MKFILKKKRGKVKGFEVKKGEIDKATIKKIDQKNRKNAIAKRRKRVQDKKKKGY